MNKSILKMALISFLLIIFQTIAYAETITLNTGITLEGKIIKRTEDLIKVQHKDVVFTLWLKDVFSIAGQSITLRQTQRRTYGEHPQLQEHIKAVKESPNDFESLMNLAGLYTSAGDGSLAAIYAERALALDPKKAKERNIYGLLMMAYYYSGNYKKSYEYNQRALEQNPNDKATQAFKEMLDVVKEREFGGEFPQSKETYTSKEQIALIKKYGRAIPSETEGGEDRIIFGFGEIVLKSPPGWSKSANLLDARGYGALLFYQKNKQKKVPSISVTRDDARKDMKSPIEYTKRIKKMMESQQGGGFIISEPKEGMINDLKVSYITLRHPKADVPGAWYQFLVEGNIISLQLITTSEHLKKDLAVFKKFALSIQVIQ